MALVKCAECSDTISDQAAACVHCGAPLSGHRGVSVNDVQMPFLSIVRLMVKVAIAALPAMFIVALFWMVLLGVFISYAFPHKPPDVAKLFPKMRMDLPTQTKPVDKATAPYSEKRIAPAQTEAACEAVIEAKIAPAKGHYDYNSTWDGLARTGIVTKNTIGKPYLYFTCKVEMVDGVWKSSGVEFKEP